MTKQHNVRQIKLNVMHPKMKEQDCLFPAVGLPDTPFLFTHQIHSNQCSTCVPAVARTLALQLSVLIFPGYILVSVLYSPRKTLAVGEHEDF